MPQRIKLYTTMGCHLCEEASSMMSFLIDNDELFSGFQLKQVEIANDDKLMSLYGVRIPVLDLNESELAWPFSFDELKSWLIKHK